MASCGHVEHLSENSWIVFLLGFFGKQVVQISYRRFVIFLFGLPFQFFKPIFEGGQTVIFFQLLQKFSSCKKIIGI